MRYITVWPPESGRRLSGIGCRWSIDGRQEIADRKIEELLRECE